MNRSARVEVYGRDRADQKDTNPETPSIVASGLVLSLDASSTSSYPGSGTTWYDLSGNGVNATMVGSPTFTTNYFTNFNGSNYFLTSAAYGPIPIGASSRTIIAGFRTPSSLSGYQHIIHYGTATQYQSFGLALYGGYLSDHTWSSASFFGNYALTPSTNYIGAVTFNDASSPRATLYVNGQAGATAYGPGVTTDYTISTGTAYQLYLGSRINPLEPLGADSRIYFVMVYNRALSSNEVLQNYNAMRSQLGL